jgi:CheY-like chemotaxis protein
MDIHPSQRSSDADRPVRTALRILVIDDDPACADSLAELLRAYGHEVETAYCAEDGLGQARAFLPDVAILDLEMPGLNGIETMQYLAHDPLCQRIALITLTGRTDPSARILSTQAGCAAHLQKPVDSERLRAALQQAAQGS